MRTFRRYLFCGVVLLAGCGETRIDTPPAADPCPVGPFGGKMVKIPALDGTSYCIDKHEVTNEAYAAFLATSPRLEDRPDICVHPPHQQDRPLLKTFVPQGTWPVSVEMANHPIMNVTWCDAAGYCSANQKRLCGKVGGGPLRDPLLSTAGDTTNYFTPAINEWINACTAGGSREVPYAGSFQKDKCLPRVDSLDTPTSDIDAERCEGGFGGIFGMIENGAEYFNFCTLNIDNPEFLPSCAVGQAGDFDKCVFSGPDYVSTSPAISFRCCADVLKN